MDKSIQKIEKQIYDAADLVFILKTYCEHHIRDCEKMNYINEVLTKISCKLDDISGCFEL